MAFNRKQVAAAVAGTLSLAMLTGCPATPTATAPSTPAPSTAASDAPAGDATPAPAATATPAGDSTATDAATPAPTPPPASGKTVPLSGKIYDEKGGLVDGADVRARSLDAAFAYDFSTKSANGSYTLNNVPEGVNIEVTVTKAGFTSRSRTGSFQAQATGERNTLDFGSASVAPSAITEASPFFISDYPEIASVSPEDESTGNSNTTLTYKLTLSEPLTADSQDALLDAFRIVPNNASAGLDGGDAYIRSNDVASDNIAANGGSKPYFIAKGNEFLSSTSNKVSGVWNAEGTELTITFNAPLLTGDKTGGKYAAILIAADDERIEDAASKRLGTNNTGSFSAAFAANTVIYNAFKAKTLTRAAESTNPWADTHDTFVDFEVARDDKDPVLQGVSAIRTTSGSKNELRIQLSFDEPMAVYGGNGKGIAQTDSLLSLANYSFAFDADRGDMDSLEMDSPTKFEVGFDGAGNTVFASSGTNSSASSTLLTETTAIRFAVQEATFLAAAASGTLNLSTSADDQATNAYKAVSAVELGAGQLAIQVSPEDPKVVFFRIGGLAARPDLKEIKARVVALKDPAGNDISTADADANERLGSID